VRALGAGNLLVEPLAPFLAGQKEMDSLVKNRKRKAGTL
jgi:hypothetical protein